MKRISLLISIFLLYTALPVLAMSLKKIEPGNWWVGMKEHRLELLAYGQNLTDATVRVDGKGVKVLAVENADSPNYLFITLDISQRTQAGHIDLVFEKDGVTQTVTYELKERESKSVMRKGFDTSDVIYLLMPDRFANGDVSNDQVTSVWEQTDRNNPNGRHGGDIAGIISKLDYLQQLGVTTIWPTPMWESNHIKNTYHGYACTDFYRIDPRYGTNALYKKLADECHAHGLKLIMDVVPNHCSISHPWVKNPPMKDWIHPMPKKAGKTLAISAWNDPHASDRDFTLNKDGWFSPLMPDLNQNNEKLLRYLIQNTIWWIEYAGLDGLRVDTYPYCERKQIAKWTKAIMNEYPHLNIVGEVWQPHTASVAYWQKDAKNYDDYNSFLPCVMDFPLMDVIQEAFVKDKPNRNRGTNQLYASLAQDYLYAYPNNILTFVDNHDTERFATLIGNDVDLYKAAIGFLLTTRGIPQLYYGTELMMKSDKEGIYSSNANRKEMNGGWPGDKRNVFTANGRTTMENDVYDYTRKLLNWRKNTPAVQYGKLKHFKPQDGIYVYFRYDDSGCVMVAMNLNDTDRTLDTKRFEEVLSGWERGMNVMTHEEYTRLEDIALPQKSTQIIELKNY